METRNLEIITTPNKILQNPRFQAKSCNYLILFWQAFFWLDPEDKIILLFIKWSSSGMNISAFLSHFLAPSLITLLSSDSNKYYNINI